MNRLLTKILILSILMSFPHMSFARETEKDSLDKAHAVLINKARANYDIGRFDQCLIELQNIEGFNKVEKTQALALSAMCYLAMDKESEADKYIEQIITMDDDYVSEAGDPERFKLRLDYIRIQLKSQQTLSVSKKAEKIELAPATIQILTADDLENRGYTNLVSVFSDLPGFDISTVYGVSYSVMYMRGYRTPQFSDRIMVLIDGIEDNDIWTNAEFISMQYPISSIKKIEVVYGPASTIYGANAFCGVINIITKDAGDHFQHKDATQTDKQAKTAITAQAGYASYNTRYADATAAYRDKNVSFSITGRVYQSDGVNLSSDGFFNGNPQYYDSSNYAIKNATDAYTKQLTVNMKGMSTAKIDSYIKSYSIPTTSNFYLSSDSTKIIPTATGIKEAEHLDSLGYKTSLKNSINFKDPLLDFYIAAKLNIQHFTFGFQYWNKNEASVGDYGTELYSSNSAYSNWQIRSYFLYAKYEHKLGDHFNLSSLTYYKYNDYGENSETTKFSGYENTGVAGSYINAGRVPGWATTQFFQMSNLMSSELKLQYVINEHFDVLAGTEFRTGIVQENYLQYGGGGNPSLVGLVPTTATDTAGGNDIAEYTISGYATASYHDIKDHLNIDLGAREDNNQYRESQGYGSVINPRADVVYFPGKKWIFKAIYSQAFEDASNQEKYSTGGTRSVSNPNLLPEKVKNFEVSARVKMSKRNYIEVVGYVAKYTNSIALAPAPGTTGNEYQDVGKSLVYGAQAASEVFLVNNISTYYNLTYTDPTSIYTSVLTHSDSSVRTGDIAPVSANAGINIPMLDQRLNLNFRVNVVGPKFAGSTAVPTSPILSIPGYGLLNATIGYKFTKNRNVLLQVGCNNILNSTYYAPGARADDILTNPPSIPQPLRNYYSKLILKF